MLQTNLKRLTRHQAYLQLDRFAKYVNVLVTCAAAVQHPAASVPDLFNTGRVAHQIEQTQCNMQNSTHVCCACRKRKGAESLTDAIIDLNTYQVHLAAPGTRSNAKTIVLKPKVADVLKPIPQPAER